METSSDATAETMAENIGKITQGDTTGTAIQSDILETKTAWVNGSKLTGTMSNNGELNWNPATSTTYTIPAGYYSGGTLDSSTAYNAGYSLGTSQSKVQNMQVKLEYSRDSAIASGWACFSKMTIPNLGWSKIKYVSSENYQYYWIGEENSNTGGVRNFTEYDISNIDSIKLNIQSLANQKSGYVIFELVV